MKLQELYNHYGNYSQIGRKLDFAAATYRGWRKKGFIPFTTQLLIERKTNGLFKASEEDAKPN